MNGHSDRQRIETEIASLFEQAGSLQEELQASLARYACVLASSYLEAAFRELVSSYTRFRAGDPIRRYVDSTLGTFRDPNMEKILQLLGRFNEEYRSSLEEQTVRELKDSLDSISANRNSVAHGRRSGISLGQVQKYYRNARTVVSKAKTILNV